MVAVIGRKLCPAKRVVQGQCRSMWDWRICLQRLGGSSLEETQEEAVGPLCPALQPRQSRADLGPDLVTRIP